MELESITKSFPIDANFDAEIKKMASEGWQIAAGSVPMAVYQLVRIKPSSTSGVGTMMIDESGVFVIPAKTFQQ